MRAKTLQIVWHEKQPVFSLDFHPEGYLATGGADREIKARVYMRGQRWWWGFVCAVAAARSFSKCKGARVLYICSFPDMMLIMSNALLSTQLWDLSTDADGWPAAHYLCALAGHTKGVNCVRFSPTGACVCAHV
jgi:WD40 repeat protein